MVNLIKWILAYIKAVRFARSMEHVIHSIHPDAKFKIHSTISKENLNTVTYNIETIDDKAMGCFILIQEAMGINEHDARSDLQVLD